MLDKEIRGWEYLRKQESEEGLLPPEEFLSFFSVLEELAELLRRCKEIYEQGS